MLEIAEGKLRRAEGSPETPKRPPGPPKIIKNSLKKAKKRPKIVNF